MGYTSLMASDEKDTFGISGPRLTVIDWNKADDRMCIVACLVKGVYVQESDRKKKRQGQNALAPPWWEFFNFKLIDVLKDTVDESVIGCIYELKTPCHSYKNRTQNYPKYVVAFRGTIIKLRNMLQDFKSNFKILFNTLQESPRVQLGLQSVEKIIYERKAEGRSIWLAGHSLGSAIALLVGRSMAEKGSHLETYLFNPPFPGLLTAARAALVKFDTLKPKQDEEFRALSGWIPHLFVNQLDPVCSGYIKYFRQREERMKFLGGKIGRHAAQNSIIIGKDCDAFHLPPSADLTINVNPLKKAHAFHQWWRRDLHLDNELHRFT